MDKLEKAKKERTKSPGAGHQDISSSHLWLGLTILKQLQPPDRFPHPQAEGLLQGRVCSAWGPELSFPCAGGCHLLLGVRRRGLAKRFWACEIEFVTGTKKGTTTNATATTTTTASTAVADAQKRKSKWDSAIPVTTIAQPTILTTTATLPAVVTVTTSASGSKTTVISAVGTIVKKAKQ
ncbi:SAP30-binding protein [Plecturocebus cupreus]